MAPVAWSRAASPVMVGRTEELHALVDLGRGLRNGPPAVVLVAGRAGMGKTRLVSEAAQRWRADGLRVLLGSCPAGGGPPFAALTAAVRRAVAPNAPLLQMLTASRGASRSEFFEAFRNTIEGLATRTALVLVVEDLHWSNRDTRDALVYLVTQASSGRWGFVGTYRYEGPLPRSDLASFADALERRPIGRVTLDALVPEQVAEQITEITGTPPTPEVAAAVHRRSGGIPLLVEEVVGSGPSGVPSHLRNLFLTRVRQQGPQIVEALRVVAVAEICDELVVAEVLRGDVAAVGAALRRAVGADLLTVDAHGYRFWHELLREAVYDDIPPGGRRELHGQLGNVLSRRPQVDSAVLAGHWYQAGSPDRTAEASLAAAAQAELFDAPASVHQHLERVLEAWPDLSESTREACGPRDELLRRAALAAERSGDYARAATLTEQRLTLASGGPSEQAKRWERLARYRWESGDGPGSRAAYQEAVRVLPSEQNCASEASTSPSGELCDAPAAVRAQVLSGLAWHLAATFHYEEAKPVADQAMAACQRVAEPAVRWQVHLAVGLAQLGTDAGQRALEESRRLALASGAGEQIALSRMWLHLSNERLGSTDDREGNLRAALRVAAAEGLGRSLEPAVRYMLVEMLLEEGRWDEADEAIEYNLRLGVTGIPAYFTWGYRSQLAAWRGDVAKLAESVARTRGLAELVPQQPVPVATALAGHAELLLWEGNARAAVTVADEASRLVGVDAVEQGKALAVLYRAEADLAEAARLHGEEIAPELLSELEARIAPGTADAPASPRLRAFRGTCSAELSRMVGHRDPDPWRDAVAAWVVTGDRYEEACARLRLAWALVATRSGRSEAAAHLAWSYETATRLGAQPLATAVKRLATRARLPLADALSEAAQGTYAAALTARELDVLPLLAAGRTNAEIAEILVISPRTVGVHVSRILHKLGAARRAETADLARRAGLLEG